MDREILIATLVSLIVGAMFTYAIYTIFSAEKRFK